MQRAERHIYLIIEYCAGGDLTNYIKKRGRVEGLEYVPFEGAPPQYFPHPKTGGLAEIAVRSFLRQLGWSLYRGFVLPFHGLTSLQPEHSSTCDSGS